MASISCPILLLVPSSFLSNFVFVSISFDKIGVCKSRSYCGNVFFSWVVKTLLVRDETFKYDIIINPSFALCTFPSSQYLQTLLDLHSPTFALRNMFNTTFELLSDFDNHGRLAGRQPFIQQLYQHHALYRLQATCIYSRLTHAKLMLDAFFCPSTLVYPLGVSKDHSISTYGQQIFPSPIVTMSPAT